MRLIYTLVALIIFNGISPSAWAEPVQLVSLESPLKLDSTKIDSKPHGAIAPQHFVLANGLHVVLQEEHSFPLVSCMVWYKVGSRNDEPGQTGLSHLVEHLLFKNIGIFRKNELGANIVRHGGQFNGFTSEDFTVFYSTLPAGQIELAICGEAERMRQAKFNQADVKAEVARLLKEVVHENNNPLAVLTRDIHEAAFQNHPYRNPPSGLARDIERLNWEEAHRFYERYFYPNNATLVVTGDFNSPSVFSSIKKHFASLPKSPGALPDLRVKESKAISATHLVVKTTGKQESLVTAYHAPSIADNDAPAMVVLEKVLNNQVTGRLKTKLIDNKICSYAQALFEMKRDPGLFVFTLNTLPGVNLNKAIDSLDSLTNQLSQQTISDEELSRAKRQAEFEFYNEIDGPYHASFHLGYFETLLRPQEARLWPEKLRSVSQADILRVAKHYFVSDARVVGQLIAQPAALAPAPASTPASKPALRTRPVPPGKIIMQRTPSARALPEPRGKEFAYIQRAGYQSEDSSIEPLLEAEKSLSPPNESESTNTSGTVKPGTVAPAANEQILDSSSAPNSLDAKEAKKETPEGAVGVVEKSGAGGVSAHAGMTGPDPANTHSKCFDNGLNVIVVQSHLSPLVQIVGSVNAGQIYENADRRGVSQLLAMSMNCGNRRETRQQVVAEQNDIGLPPSEMIKFESGIEQIGFKTRCLAKDLSTQLRLLAFSLREPRYQDADVDKSKTELITNIARSEDSVSSKAQRALLRSLISPGSPYCPLDPSEIATSINELKAQDIRDFHDTCVLPNATTLVLVGDLEAKEVFSLVESAFADWTMNRKNALAKPPLAVSDRQSAKSSLIVKEGQQNLVCLGRIIGANVDTKIDYRDKEEWSQLLLADCVLSNHPIFSRISQRFDYEPTLVTSFDQLKSRLKPLCDRVVWSLSIPLVGSADLKQSANAIVAIQNELKRFGKSGITGHELNEAKHYLLGALPVTQMSNLQQLSESALDQFVLFGDLNSFHHLYNALGGARLDSVNKFITVRFKPDESSLVVAGTRQLIRQTHNNSIHPQQLSAPEIDKSWSQAEKVQ